MFRDQSDVTVSKCKAVEPEGETSSVVPRPCSPEDFNDLTTDSERTSLELALRAPSVDDISGSLSVSPEDQAACYFFSNYVLMPTHFRKGYMNYLPGLYGNKGPESPLAQMIVSLGMAGLANVRNAPEAKAVSTYKYASALHSVNAMLRDPVRATNDETLVLVLLLSLYEVSPCHRIDGITDQQ